MFSKSLRMSGHAISAGISRKLLARSRKFCARDGLVMPPAGPAAVARFLIIMADLTRNEIDGFSGQQLTKERCQSLSRIQP
jgi:hypothetical protein